ncbi:hypothetical protein M139_2090 [Bacteroides fragilis str. S23L24]|nr:hypothetical protein M139_2090 [Bacteroides fragilis str. S23L24]EYE41126.1 hypothetical protein M138_4915 [Bacteroides fragilis str. S23L17]
MLFLCPNLPVCAFRKWGGYIFRAAYRRAACHVTRFVSVQNVSYGTMHFTVSDG